MEWDKMKNDSEGKSHTRRGRGVGVVGVATTAPADPEDRVFGQRWLFSGLESKWHFPAGFQTCLRLVTPLSLPISSFWKGNVYLMAVPLLYMERNFDPGQAIYSLTWFRMRFGTLSWCRMDWSSWGCWDGVNVFCMWAKHEFWETRGKIIYWVELYFHKRLCSSLNSWFLWIWLYLEIGPLQM